MAAETYVAQMVSQAIRDTLIATAASNLAAGCSSAVAGCSSAVAATSVVATTATTLATSAETIAPVVYELAPLTYGNLYWLLGGAVKIAAAMGGVALAIKGIFFICEKGYTYVSNVKKAKKKNKEKVEEEVDPFSSESVKEMVADLINHLQEPSNKVVENKDKDKEEEDINKCITTENAGETDNNMSGDEESAPAEKRKKVCLTRKSCCSNGTLSGSYHLVRRLTRFLRVAGMAEFGEDWFKIPKNNVFQPGPSETKDKVCKVKEHHASHVVRLKIAPDAAKNGPFHVNLKKFLGHTHCVHRKFNICIGKEIDTLQGNMLPKLLSIDWRKEKPEQLSVDAANVLNTIKNEWLKLLQRAIAKPSYDEEQNEELGKAYSYIDAISLKLLCSKTKVGIDYLKAAADIKKEIEDKIETFLQTRN